MPFKVLFICTDKPINGSCTQLRDPSGHIIGWYKKKKMQLNMSDSFVDLQFHKRLPSMFNLLQNNSCLFSLSETRACSVVPRECSMLACLGCRQATDSCAQCWTNSGSSSLCTKLNNDSYAVYQYKSWLTTISSRQDLVWLVFLFCPSR